jgi:4,4'-diaponeurosporenoate glycosyltransferase
MLFSVCLILSFWLFGFYFLWRVPRLESSSEKKINADHLSIIIPARNEEKNLKRLLKSLTRQSVKAGEIIVVDDHSEDATSDIAIEEGSLLIHSKPLPEGWVGKPWACWQGALQTKGEILLFLDADTRLESDGIHRLLSTFYQNQRGGLLSVQPYHQMKKWYERLAAFFNIITVSGMNAFTLLGDRIKPIGAFGPCNVCLKTDYFNIGGHEMVRGDILESLGLGRAFIDKGLPVHCYGGLDAISFRMYPEGFNSLVEGFSKGFGLGAKATTVMGQILIFCWVYAGVHLTRILIQMAVAGDIKGLIIFGTLNILFILQIHWMLKRIGNFKLITALFFQIPLIFFIVVFLISMFKIFILKRATWKGRALLTKKG